MLYAYIYITKMRSWVGGVIIPLEWLGGSVARRLPPLGFVPRAQERMVSRIIRTYRES